MREPRSYIVRIYRQGYRTLSGIVEEPGSGAVRTFRTEEELLGILRARGARTTVPPRRDLGSTK